jgi:UDP-GlcNAc3NAcA epimerase
VKILTVVGNRPQFIKAAAVSGPLREQHEELLVHTGQHYDDSLSRVFFTELGLARPDRELNIGGGSNTSQTTRMLAALEPLLGELEPDAVLLYGDTNSTLAGALAAADAGLPIVHVEAGMRSFDKAMPEERNRVMTDHLSGLLLCPSDTAAANLRAESVSGRIEVVGDVMVDVALRRQPSARADGDTPRAHGVRPGAYLLLTAHRAGNVDDPERLRSLVGILEALPGPVVFPMHPRTRARLSEAGLLERLAQMEGLHLSEPLGYVEFSALVCQARAVVTDSGGVQKEAYLAGVPCVTLRANTEWVETVTAGWNTLVDLDTEAALSALAAEPPSDERPALYGDGHAAERCVEAIGTLLLQPERHRPSSS